MKVSNCCKAPVKVLKGIGEDGKPNGTVWWLCTKCGKYCSTVQRDPREG